LHNFATLSLRYSVFCIVTRFDADCM